MTKLPPAYILATVGNLEDKVPIKEVCIDPSTDLRLHLARG